MPGGQAPPIDTVPLNKAGLHKPCRDWLVALPEYKFLGAWGLFDAGATRCVVLNKYEGKIADGNGVLHKRTFCEVPDKLYLVSNTYVLLTKLQYYEATGPYWMEVGVSKWNPWQALTVAYEDVTGRRYYEHFGGTYDDQLPNVSWKYSGLTPPPVFVAPMPAPAIGSDITTLFTNDFSDLSGYVRFTQNPNGTLNFRCEVTWTSNNESSLSFSFPVPILARGKSFIPSVFCPEQAITASVVPKVGDNMISVLTTGAWTIGAGVHIFVFEANNIP